MRLTAPATDGGASVSGRVVLEVGGQRIPVEMTVPAGDVAVEDLLPVLQGLSSLFAQRAQARVEAEGLAVSCRAGCGACCRQLVPIAAAEARAIARLVNAMPEPRRSQVRRRFDDAIETLDAGGILERIGRDPGDRWSVSLDYFRAGVACPFLENEACSIHADRPMACREYLVTSPPAHCADLSAPIAGVELEAAPSVALLKTDLRDGWTPLVLALVHDDEAPPSPHDRPAPEILRDVIEAL